MSVLAGVAAHRAGEAVVDLSWSLERVSECECGLARDTDTRSFSQDLLGPRRSSLHHKRGDIEVRRGRNSLEQRFVSRADPDLQAFFLERRHVLTWPYVTGLSS
jgi:hypothetical protein